MEYTSNATSQFETLPSFLKWLKTQPNEVQGKVQVVTKVWFPSKFPNFTVDTESYRLRVPVTGDEVLVLTHLFEHTIESEEVLAVRVDDKRKAKFTIISLRGEKGTWEELGTSGYVCTVQDKPKGKKTCP